MMRRLLLLLLLFSPADLLRAAELRLGTAVEREISAGATDQHTMDLDADRYLVIGVEQLGADVALALVAPDGERLIEMDYRRGRRGVEPLEWVTPTGGRYLLEVRCSDAGEDGRYRAVIETLRPASAEDPYLVRAEREYLLGNLAQRREGAEPLERAARHYRDGLELWRQAKHPEGQAKTLHNLGGVLARQRQDEAALAAYEEAVGLWPEPRHRLDSLAEIGSIHLRGRRPQPALSAFESALELAREAQNQAQEVRFLRLIGRTHQQAFRSEEALASHRLALEISRRLESDRLEAEALLSLAQTYSEYGQDQQALEHGLEAWEIVRRLDERSAISARQIGGTLLNTLGISYQKLGLHEQALFFFDRALERARALGQDRGEARILTNIGWSYRFSGEPEKAVEALEGALELQRTLGDLRAQAATLNNLGRSLQALQRLPEARRHHEQALEIYRRLGDRPGQARTLISSARLAIDERRPERALEVVAQSLALEPDPVHLSSVLWVQAQAQRQKGQLDLALELAVRATSEIESRRASILGIEQRAEFLATQRDVFELRIELLMELAALRPDEGYAARALVISEQARARSLTELLDRSRVGRVDPALAAKKEALQRRLNALELRLASQRQHGTESGTEVSRTLDEELQTTLIEYQAVRSKIRGGDQRLAEWTAPAPPDAAEIHAVLDPETLLLEYFLAEERSFLWLVSADAVHGFELPPRAEIEELARRAYDALAVRESQPEEPLSLRSLRLADADREFERLAKTLSRILLGPVAPFLDRQRLVIVSDGALHYVPFSALPRPVGATPEERTPPLVVDHEIVHLPSVGALRALRHEAARRAEPRRSLFVLADPVFSRLDHRLPVGAEQTTTQRSAELLPQSFQRLRFTRLEAQGISALAPAPTTVVLDFAASRQSLEEQGLEQYRILHFATHGVLNSRHPELSALVLALVDEEGRSVDGFLRLHDIHDLRLNAELVVLSACRTALGRQIRGEGLIGLTRGFMYAGAASVLASLWTVQDRATKELMTRFYRSLFEDRQPPPAALRSAQLELLSQPRFRAPYYWAGFTLQGDWRPAGGNVSSAADTPGRQPTELQGGDHADRREQHRRERRIPGQRRSAVRPLRGAEDSLSKGDGGLRAVQR